MGLLTCLTAHLKKIQKLLVLILHASRSAVGNVRTLKNKRFICNEIRTADNEAYNYVGFVRITSEDTADEIERKIMFLVNKESRIFQAA